MRYSPAQIDDIKARNPVDGYAQKFVTLRRRGNVSVGPCPLCSTDSSSRTATRFEATSDHWVCAVCQDGGDVIRLAARLNGLDPERDFVKCLELLGGAAAIDEEEAARRDRARADRKRRQEADEIRYREKERARCFEMWRSARPVAGTDAERYLALRGVSAPAEAHLRFLPDAGFYAWDTSARRFVRIHTGPAMLGALTDSGGTFRGLHMTYIDLSRRKGKAEIVNPATGEIETAKKMRGSKRGNRIVLARALSASTLVVGEGIEKVLAVWRALSASTPNLAAWSSGDLGNLGGPALGTIAHPELRTAQGRPQRVPGDEPDMEKPAIAVPESVSDLVLLGDSTSDRFTTAMHLRRAAARYARPGRSVRIVWAPEGRDFDDLYRDGVAA